MQCGQRRLPPLSSISGSRPLVESVFRTCSFAQSSSPAFIFSSVTRFDQFFSAMAVVDFLFTPWTLLALPIFFYLLPYLRNSSLRDIPGPLFAKFSNLWLMYQCRRGKRYLAVHDVSG